MLNAVKHLYRFVERLCNGAVEMLHCVQHDKRFLIYLPLHKTLRLRLLLAAHQPHRVAVAVLLGQQAVLVVGQGAPAIVAAHAALGQVEVQPGLAVGLEVGGVLLLFAQAGV